MTVLEGWEIRRRTARFRGVDLVILSSTRTGGRRLDVHQFANRSLPYAEDLGREARVFSVRGLVIGADHDLAAEALEAAFEKPGPGELVLPHRAPISVAVRSYSFEEPETQTRLQRFEVEFVEAGLATAPGARANTAGAVEDRATTSLESLADRFVATFGLRDQTAAAIDRAVEIAQGGAAKIQGAFAVLKAGQPALNEVAAFARDLETFQLAISGSIVDAAVTARQFQEALDFLLELPFAPLDVYEQLADVVEYGVDLADPGSVTLSRATAQRNQNALVDLLSQSATTVRAKALARATFESSTEAAGYRDEIAAELSRAITVASDRFADGAVSALRALRTATIRDLDSRGARLPERVTWAVPYPLPSLVIAQRLYGDWTREAEIVARNRAVVRNPGRIAYGTPLEVLVDA